MSDLSGSLEKNNICSFSGLSAVNVNLVQFANKLLGYIYHRRIYWSDTINGRRFLWISNLLELAPSIREKMDSGKYFGICIVILSLEVQNSFSETTSVATTDTTGIANNTEEWFVYNLLTNSSFRWNDSLLNTSSPYYMSLSNETKNELSGRNIITVLFQRVYTLRFLAINISLNEYEKRFGNNTTFFSGPPTEVSEGEFYSQPLRFSLDGAVLDSNVTEFLTEYLKCFYKTEVSNLTVNRSDDVMVNFAAEESDLSTLLSFDERDFFAGPILNRILFEATNDTTREAAFDLSTCEEEGFTTTNNPLPNGVGPTSRETSAMSSPTTVSSTFPKDSIQTTTSSTTAGPSTNSQVVTTVNSAGTTANSVATTTVVGNVPTTQTESIHSTTTSQTQAATPFVSTLESTTSHVSTTSEKETTTSISDINSSTPKTPKEETTPLQIDSTTFIGATTPSKPTTADHTQFVSTMKSSTDSALIQSASLQSTNENLSTQRTHLTTGKPEQTSAARPSEHQTTVNEVTTLLELNSWHPTTSYSTTANPISETSSVTDGQTAAVCQSTTLERDGQNLTFPSVAVGGYSDSVQRCEDGSRPLGSIRCVESGVGNFFHNETILLAPCSENLTTILQGLDNYTQAGLVELLRILDLFVSSDTVEENDLNNLADIFLIASSAFEEVSMDVVRVAMNLANKLAGIEIVDPAVYSKIVTALEQFALRLDPSGSTSITTGDIGVQSFVVNTNENFRESILFNDEVVIDLEVPSSAFNSSSASTRLAVIYFNSSQLFPSAAPTSPRNVLSITLPGAPVKNLETFIDITFASVREEQGKANIPNSLKAIRTTAECMFYDNNTWQWSTVGVYVNSSSNPISCHSNHLTSFAVIVTQTDATQTLLLSTVTNVGCILTIIGTSATIILHIITKKWRKNRPIMEMLHACFCILITYIIFLAGVGNADYRESCIAVTALLQYFFLATWCWLFIYSRDMYTSIVKVFSEHQSRYMTKMVILAYGIPLLIVVFHVSLVIGHFDKTNTVQTIDRGPIVTESYYYSEHVCWLTGYSLYIGFLLPVGLVMLHNVLVILLVIYEIVWKSAAIESSAQKKDAKSNLVLGVVIFFLVGGTWIFMFLLIISEEFTYQTVMSWIFTLLNTLQGFFIFLILCVRSKDVRKVWLTPLRNKIYVPIVTIFRRRGSRSSDDSGRFSKTMLSGSNTDWNSTQISEGSPTRLKRNNKISDSSGDLSMGRINHAFELDSSLTKDCERPPSAARGGSNEEISRTTIFEIDNNEQCTVIVTPPEVK